MHIETLNIEEFNFFQQNHYLSNYHQTINYAMLKSENGYDYELIGLKDNDNNIIAASLILLKKIGNQFLYGYAPRGFLIDYNDENIVKIFVEELKKYYFNKKVIFIKTNPLIPIGEVNPNNYNIKYNDNYKIKEKFPQYGFKKLNDNLYFEAQLPRFNAIIDLKKFDISLINKNTRNKIKKGIRKGLVFTHASKDDLPIFYNLLKNQTNKNEYYYQDYYTVFAKNDAIDLFLVSIDYNTFLENSQDIYNKTAKENNILNEKLIKYNTDKNINAKMNSDKVLLTYKNDILEASKGINREDTVYIASAIVIKHNDLATIIISTFDKNYKRFAPNYFLYYNIIKYYQNDYDYLDLNGVVGDFKNENPYSGLNRFKLGFNPRILEYMGEYDLVINTKIYDFLLHNGILKKEFEKNVR